jgi:hypothetical protein
MALAMDEDRTQWGIEQAGVPANQAQSLVCDAVDGLHSATIRRVPGTARLLAVNEGINALMHHHVSVSSGSTSAAATSATSRKRRRTGESAGTPTAAAKHLHTQAPAG